MGKGDSMKGLKFWIMNNGCGYNDKAWHVALPHPGTKSNPNPPAEFWRVPFLMTLIYHPDAGYILYDVGAFPGDEAGARSPIHSEYFPMEATRDCFIDRRLAELGLTVDDISMIVLSHLHWDHAHGLKFFSNTRAGKNIYVSRKEFEYALVETHLRDDEATSDSAYFRSIMDIPGLEYHLLEEDCEFLTGMHLIMLGGHTPGVMGMLLELESGNYLFPSDAAYSTINYGPPAKLPGIIYDTLGFYDSIKKLYRIEKQYQAKLIFPHDDESAKQYKFSPDFYE